MLCLELKKSNKYMCAEKKPNGKMLVKMLTKSEFEKGVKAGELTLFKGTKTQAKATKKPVTKAKKPKTK